MTIGEKLTRARGARSRKEVAYALGVSVSAIERYESNAGVPRDEVKIRMANYFNVSMQFLFL